MADMNLDVTNKLRNESKMMFYHAVIGNNLDLFASYIYGNENRPPFDIFEEVSAPGKKWTVFHYAMHYGQWEIIKFIFDYLKEKNLLDKALKMKSDDNRCPMLCLIKSNALRLNKKKEIYFKILETYQIQVSDEVFRETIKRHFYDNENLDTEILCKCSKTFDRKEFNNHFKNCEAYKNEFKDFEFKLSLLLKEYINKDNLELAQYLFKEYLKLIKYKIKKCKDEIKKIQNKYLKPKINEKKEKIKNNINVEGDDLLNRIEQNNLYK